MDLWSRKSGSADSTDANARWQVVARVVVLLAVVVAFGVLIWQRRWMSDDGFINIRIVQNLLAGHGPVFNVGERVEAYTSPLWLGVVAGLGAVGVRPAYAAVTAGAAFSVAGIGCAMAAAIRLRAARDDWWRDLRRHWYLPAGAVVYGAIPVAWDYGTSGLENGLGLLWLGGTYLLVSGRCLRGGSEPTDGRWRDAMVASLAGLGPLVRPELALFGVAFLAPLIWTRARSSDGAFSWVRAAELGGSAGAIPLIYEVWRAGYFAALVPNTAVAKAAFGSRWQQGWYYVENFYGLYGLALPLALLVLLAVQWGASRLNRDELVRLGLAVGPVAAGLGYSLYVVRIGGGFMHGRLFLLPLFGMLLPFAVVRPVGAGRPAPAWRVTALAILYVWAGYCALQIRVPKENQHGIGDERGWYVRKAGVPNPITVEDYSEMYYTADALEPRNAAEEHCPAAFSESDADAGGRDTSCERVVYVDVDEAGDLYPEPSRKVYPLRDRVADHGYVLAAARTGIGIRSLVMGPKIHLVSRAGLASPVASRIALDGRGRPGHERDLNNEWFAGRFVAPESGDAVPAVISAARRALTCGRLGRLDRAVTRPLTVGRFLNNIVEAFRLRGLTIPRNPHVAKHKFCGTEPVTSNVAGGRGGDPHRWYCPEGYVLSGMAATPAPDEEAIANVRPKCRRLETSGSDPELAGDPVAGPDFGGDSAQSARRLNCSGGRAVRGLQVVADRFVRGIGLQCGRPRRTESNGPVSLASGGRTSVVGTDGESVDLTCPSGTLPAGLKVRSGALIDAIVLGCRESDGS